jgi:hypothetical protein
MHISHHIHECRQWCRLIRDKIPDQYLMDWFVKSLFSLTAKDVAMLREVNEERVILHAQHLDLIYS